MSLVVLDGHGQGLGGQERGLHGGEPALELVRDGTDLGASVGEERVAGETSPLGLLFGGVDRADEGAALGGENGLCLLGVAELAAAVRVTAGLDDVPRGVDRFESVLGVGGELAAERAQLRDDIVAALVGGILEDGALAVPIELDVAVVRRREIRNEDLQPGAVGRHPRSGQELLPVEAVDRREHVGSALDEADERAHRERHAAVGKVATDAVEGRSRGTGRSFGERRGDVGAP